MTDTKQAVGAQIQMLRKQHGISQEELAARVGIDAKSLSRIERGVHYPSLDTLEKIQIELNVEMKDFFDFTGSESVQEMRNFLIKVANKSDETTLKEITAAVRQILSKNQIITK